MLLRPAFEKAANVTFATTDAKLATAHDVSNCIELKDYSRSEPLSVTVGLCETFLLIRRLKPDFVISTGAAPGLLLLLWARIFGAKTLWIDSIANAEQPSMSGRLALRFAHISLTQWEHLSEQSSFKYWGSIL